MHDDTTGLVILLLSKRNEAHLLSVFSVPVSVCVLFHVSGKEYLGFGFENNDPVWYEALI
jgi:hypothetical protein